MTHITIYPLDEVLPLMNTLYYSLSFDWWPKTPLEHDQAPRGAMWEPGVVPDHGKMPRLRASSSCLARVSQLSIFSVFAVHVIVGGVFAL